MKRLTVRIDKLDSHAHVTVFVDGAFAGRLVFRAAEWVMIDKILRAGCSICKIEYDMG